MASTSGSSSPGRADPLLIPRGEYAGKKPMKLQKSVVVIGADERCHLHLISSSVSRHHALLIHDQDGVYVRDLGSRTKVVVNGQPQREALLVDEDEIHFGKFSFRFAANGLAADAGAPIPSARVMVNGRVVGEMKGRTLLIGHGEGCDISLPADLVSSRHAVIFIAKGKRYVRDLDSRTGTFLKGEKIHQSEIHPGEELRVGETIITLAEAVEIAEAPAPEAVSRKPEPALPVEAEEEIPVARAASPETASGASGDAIPLELEPEATEPNRDEMEREPEIPIAEAADVGAGTDSIALELEPESQPPEEPLPVAGKVEPEAEVSEPQSAEMDLSLDSIPVEMEAEAELKTPDAPIPVEAATETEPEISAPQTAELDLSLDSIPVEMEAEVPSPDAAPVESSPQPVADPALPEIDLSQTQPAAEAEPAVEPRPEAVEEPAGPREETGVDAAPEPASETIEVHREPDVSVIGGSETHEIFEGGHVVSDYVPNVDAPAVDLSLDLELAAQMQAGEPVPVNPPVAPEPASDAVGETPKKRAVRGRKPAAADKTKAPKPARGRAKRIPPPSTGPSEIADRVAEGSGVAESLAPIAPIAEVESAVGENFSQEAAAEPVLVDVTAPAFIVEAPTEEPPAEEIPEPEISADQSEPPPILAELEFSEVPEAPDDWNVVATTSDDISAPAAVGIEPEAAVEEPSPHPAETNGGEEEETGYQEAAIEPAVIVPEDQPPEVSSAAIESEIPEPQEGEFQEGDEDLSIGGWNLPEATSGEISAPINSEVAPPVEPIPAGPSSAPGPVGQRKNPSVIQTPLSALSGYGYLGGGTVNLDHFIGGMPIQLGELPAAPEGFGNIKIELGGDPRRPSAGLPWTAAQVSPPPAASPPPPPPPRSPVSPQTSGQPFATDIYHPEEEDSPQKPERKAEGVAAVNPFDGLAAGAHGVDVFTRFESLPAAGKESAAGGAPPRPERNYVIPAGPPLGDDGQLKPTDELDGLVVPPTPKSPKDDTDNSGGEPIGDDMIADNGLAGESGEHFSEMMEAEEPMAARAAPAPQDSPPAKKRRFRIPFFMPIVLLAVGAAMAGIWRFIRIPSQISGTMTFRNLVLTPGTQDAIDFEASQRELLDDSTRRRASELLARDNSGAGQGFLASSASFAPIAASISLNSSGQSAAPETLLQLSTTSEDKDGDRLRMLAVLQSLADRNGPRVDANRRLQDQLRRAQQTVDEDDRKLERIKSGLADVQAAIDGAPAAELLAVQTRHKAALEQTRLDAEAAVSRDRAEIARLQAAVASDVATTQPAADDPQLRQMRQQLADLSAEMDSARSDQIAGATLARQKLEAAAKQFDDQIASANALLGSGSQLREFVDSAMEAQTKARDLIGMLIVDGEDLEQQLEDTRRDLEDLIETQQADKWALDPELQSMRENLNSAQHRYNANAGEGITDPRTLDPLQKEIDKWTAQVKRRQAELGADPSELRVQQSLDSVIASLRKKLAKEKIQTDEVLDPLQKQLANLDPVIAALPATQQDLAREIHARLDALNEARENYAQTVGDAGIAPSAKVAELKSRIADLRAGIAARQADVVRAAAVARDLQRSGDLTAAQGRLQADQAKFEAAQAAMETRLGGYVELHAKQEAAESAQQRKMNLLDDQRSAFTELEAARKDRDEKQSAADHAFDIKPVAASDVVIVTPPDPRMMYCLEVMGAGLVVIALATLVSHGGPRRGGKKSVAAAEHEPDFDSLVIPLAPDDDHTATA